MVNTITEAMGFRLARTASKLSTHDQHKIGAVIVKKRKPISVGANLLKTHPVYADGNSWFSIHAEMKALISAETSVIGCDIYVYRVTAQDELAMARPCNACFEVLAEAGLRRVYYTTPNGYNMEYLENGKTEERSLQLLFTTSQ